MTDKNIGFGASAHLTPEYKADQKEMNAMARSMLDNASRYVVTPESLAAQEAQSKQDALDAARYRWLRDSSANQWEFPIVVSQKREPERMLYLGPVTGAALNKSVDAAIAAEKEPKK